MRSTDGRLPLLAAVSAIIAALLLGALAGGCGNQTDQARQINDDAAGMLDVVFAKQQAGQDLRSTIQNYLAQKNTDKAVENMRYLITMMQESVQPTLDARAKIDEALALDIDRDYRAHLQAEQDLLQKMADLDNAVADLYGALLPDPGSQSDQVKALRAKVQQLAQDVKDINESLGDA